MRLREYETICIFKPYVSPEIVEKLVQKLQPAFTAEGGSLIRSQIWGRKRLAYIINKEREGLYVSLHYAVPASIITEVEKIISYDENVGKFLTIKKSDEVKDIAALKQAKEPEIPAIFRGDADRGDYRPASPIEDRSSVQEGVS